MVFKTRQEWLSCNPLRMWLRENDETVVDFAARIGRNPSSIHMWLRGAIIPTDSFWMLKIAMKNEKVEEQWAEWAQAQPGKIA